MPRTSLEPVCEAVAAVIRQWSERWFAAALTLEALASCWLAVSAYMLVSA